jgi:hypothetical protein
MALTPGGQAPYTTVASLRAVLDWLRDKTPTAPLTAETLKNIGVQESLANRTMRSLETLDIVKSDGALTDQFLDLLSLRDDVEYTQRLQEWVRSTYADVLNYCDPTTDGPETVASKFRGYLPAGQRSAMAALFLGLWRYAGLPTAQPPRDTTPAKPKRVHRPGTDRGRGEGAQGRTRSQSGDGTPKPLSAGGLPPGLVGLLQQIPKDGTSWTSEERDQFIEAFAAVLNFTVRVDDNPNDEFEEASAGVDS